VSYALPRSPVLQGGEVHNTHREQVDLQLTREPRPLPKLSIQHSWFEESPLSALLRIKYEDLKLKGYDPYPKIKAEVSV
jgi:thymidylate synthase